jgi:hypothetical protein
MGARKCARAIQSYSIHSELDSKGAKQLGHTTTQQHRKHHEKAAAHMSHIHAQHLCGACALNNTDRTDVLADVRFLPEATLLWAAPWTAPRDASINKTINGCTWIHKYAHGCTWIHKYAHGYTSMHMDTQVRTWIHKYAHGCTWIHKHARICTWIHMYAHGYTSAHTYAHGWTWIHMVAHGKTCKHTDAHGDTWMHTDTDGSTWIHMDAHRYTWYTWCLLYLPWVLFLSMEVTTSEECGVSCRNT